MTAPKEGGSVSVAERIARGKAAIEALEFEFAAEELMIAAAQTSATKEELVEANLFAGIANRVLRRDVDARLNFRFVLQNRPDAVFPAGTAPKIVSFFELIRQELSPPSTSAPAPDETLTETPSPPGRDGVSPLMIGGVVGLVVGAVMTTTGAGVAIGSEWLLGDKTTDGEIKNLAGTGFYVGFGAVAVGLAVTAVGLTVAAVSFVE